MLFLSDLTARSRRRQQKLTSSNWRHMERLVQAVVSDCIAEKLKILSETLHSLAVQNKLLHNKNNSL
jgi:hypothetical protein